MFTRVLDLAVLLLVAVALLMPRPDVKVQPGLKLDPERRQRVAELESHLLASRADAVASLELADLYLDARRPDWALAALGGAIDRAPHDHRLHGRRSLALADHFEAFHAYEAAEKALALCQSGSSTPCSETEHSRLQLLRDTLERVKGVDMRKDPNTAKERILKGLRPVYVPPQRPSAPAGR
jgi:hypothetical protein